MPTWLIGWLPPLSVILTVAVILTLTRSPFFRRAAGPGAIHRQGLSALLVVVGLLAVVVTLPIDDSTRGQLLSLIGLLISAAIALSSTTFVGNMMAGVLLRMLRNFRPGDFVRVEGNFGRVSEQGLLHTEIQTEDRDLITLPNLFLVTHPVRVIRPSGTVISADVSLGYDVPRSTVKAALLAAAEAADLTEPFVRIIDLGDFSVSYRAAGILGDVKQLLTSRSLLRARVLDHLHAAGIEIVSPTFMNQRVVPAERIFMPATEGDPKQQDRSEEIFPEEVIFDKADKAESIEKLRIAHESLAKKVEELEARRDEITEESERTSLERRLKRSRDLRERLARRIDESEAE